jgi:GNAT superfamily N-acetyltransferase
MPRLLRPDDIPALMRLKESASWNQTVADWQRVMAVEPEGCFGIDCEDTLAACATAVRYGTDLGWIGMVLTLPEFRGRGLARRLMEQCIEYCECSGVRWMKLDATDMGAPLYRKLGFEDECIVERRMRAAAGETACAAAGGQPVRPASDLALDRRAFGADRGNLLAALAGESSVSIPGEGYAMARAGSKAAYFGPCVARSAESARRFVEWFLTAYPGVPLYWDVLEENAAAVALANEFGFTTVRRLVRMGRRGVPAAAPLKGDSSLVFAIAGFEFG